MYCEYTLTLLHTMVSFIHSRHLIHRRLIKKTMHSDALKIALAFEWKQSPLPSLTFPDKRYIFSYCRITLDCSTVFLSILHALTHLFLKSGLHATEWQSKSNSFRLDYFIWSKSEAGTFFLRQGVGSFLCFGHQPLECLAYDINECKIFSKSLFALFDGPLSVLIDLSVMMIA